MKPRHAIAVAKRALRQGLLRQEGHQYRYYQRTKRRFNYETIAMLLDAGEAVRAGEHIKGKPEGTE